MLKIIWTLNGSQFPSTTEVSKPTPANYHSFLWPSTERWRSTRRVDRVSIPYLPTIPAPPLSQKAHC